MKDIEQIRIDFNNSIAGTYDRNRECIEDLEFAVVRGAQWRGSFGKQFKNKPKPEFNQVFRNVNRILGQKQNMEMNARIISNSDDATDKDADLLQSRWRNDFQMTDGVEANNNSDMEAFFCGFGAKKVVAKYEDEESPDPDKQYLCVEPIYSAASSVVFNAGAIRKDKADAKQCWQLFRVNRKEIEEEYGLDVTAWPDAASGLDYFDWCTDSNKDIYIAHYYEVVEKKLTDYDFGGGYIVTTGDGIKDSFGNKLTRDELKELREFNEPEVRKRKVKRVEYALICGDKFLESPSVTPFKRIPVIPQYGYHAVINGVEYYCGEVRKQKDPQRFFNTYASSMMEIMAAPQVQKPEYLPEQIMRHANSRARANIDNVPFIMSDPYEDDKGNKAFGPIGYQEPPQIGTGMAAAGQLLQGQMDLLGGTGQSTLPANSSGEAVQQVNMRQDDSYQPLMQNSMHALKAACECWIPAAQKLYFTNERMLRIITTDGSYSQVMTLQYDTNESGEYGPYKNSARGKYSVEVKNHESYKSQKDAEKQSALEMLQMVGTDTEMGQLLAYQAMLSTTGDGMSDMRRVARFRMLDLMISMGVDPQPESEEEQEYVQQKMQQFSMQQQQSQMQMQAQQQAMMQTQLKAIQDEGQARLLEGQAAIMNEQNDRAELAIKDKKANADVMKVMGDLQLKGEELSLKRVEQFAQAAQAQLPQNNLAES